jgi:PAS domain S-box-containing protein
VNLGFVQRGGSATYWALLTVIFLVILSLDLLLPFGHVAAALYVIPVFLTVLTGRVAWVVRTTIAAFVATLLGFLNTPGAIAAPDASQHAFTRATIGLMILAAGAVGALLIARSNRLAAVSGELSSTAEELENKERLVRTVTQVGKVAGWSLAREKGSPVVWSDDAERIFGMNPGQPTLRDDLLAFIDEQVDRDRLMAAALDCLRDGTPFVVTFRATASNGRRLWVTVMGEASRDAEGRVIGIAGALQDVTLWKEAEATATVEGQRFGQFANSLPSVIWTAEPSGTIDYCNQALSDYSGRTLDQLLDDQWVDLVHLDDVANILGEWQRAVATGEPYSTAVRLRRADGEYRWFRVAARAEHGDDGNVVKWWGNAVDIHEARLLRETATRLAQEREDILQTIGDGVFTVDSDLRFTYFNKNAELLMRRPTAPFLGEVLWDIFPHAKGANLEAAFDAARATGTIRPFSHYSPVMERWFEGNASPSPSGITVSFRDVTEFKSVSEQLAQAQRMESVGRLTGGIAHDFNNLLTVVGGGAEALGDEPGLTEDGREMLGLVARAAARGAELTHQLLAFSRLQPLAPQLVDVSARIREMAPILSRAIGPGITEVAELEDGLPAALVDPGQLENALLNLAINAGDAMPDGGTLTISTEFARLDEAYATLRAEVLLGDYVVISVGDTGTGISEQDLPHIFEPFFTTKPVGEGSGLGLAMVWGFAKQTGGHVTVYSEEGLGSLFRLYLPVAAEGAERADAPGPNLRTPSRGSGHILLAEDDPLVRQFAADRLIDHGFEVTVASSGAEALELLAGIETLALLFTDVIMKGGVSGRDLADEVVALRPGTPVLFASGYTEDVMVHQGRLDPDVALLPKPYTGRQLIDRIHAVLGGDGTGVGP